MFVTVISGFFRQLDAGVEASGPHDFAVRVSTIRQARRPRPPHPAPYVRDDRETPLFRERDGGGYRFDLGKSRSEIFLQTGLDRANQLDPASEFGLSEQTNSARYRAIVQRSSSCPALYRASTSLLHVARKTWTAGTTPGHDEKTNRFQVVRKSLKMLDTFPVRLSGSGPHRCL